MFLICGMREVAQVVPRVSRLGSNLPTNHGNILMGWGGWGSGGGVGDGLSHPAGEGGRNESL